jgi:hypothetical protein
MKRVLSAAIVLAVGCSLVACGGGGGGSGGGGGGDDDDVVGWTTELDSDAPTLLSYFSGKAESYGCKTAKHEANAVVEKCPEGPIIMLKEGRKVTVGCKSMSLAECRGLFKRISEAN